MLTADQRLADALGAEHATIFGYGAVGPWLIGEERALVVRAEAAHRTRRDTLLLRLTAQGVPAPNAEPAYALPFPVTDRATALRLAVTLEERTAAIWRQVLPEATGEERSIALDALTDCAVRAARLRSVAGVSPAVVPFPGAPD